MATRPPRSSAFSSATAYLTLLLLASSVLPHLAGSSEEVAHASHHGGDISDGYRTRGHQPDPDAAGGGEGAATGGLGPTAKAAEDYAASGWHYEEDYGEGNATGESPGGAGSTVSAVGGEHLRSSATATERQSAPASTPLCNVTADGPHHFHHHNIHQLHDHDHMDMSTSSNSTGYTVWGYAAYFQGFRLTYFSTPSTPCLNVLIPAYTLDSRGKVTASFIGIILLAAFSEGVAYVRLRIRRTVFAGCCKKLVIVLMHALQAALGYALMLAASSYSFEVLLAVLTGLAVGYAVFFDDDKDAEYDPEKSLAGAVHVTTNPCCAFMGDEALEHKRPPGPCECACAAKNVYRTTRRRKKGVPSRV